VRSRCLRAGQRGGSLCSRSSMTRTRGRKSTARRTPRAAGRTRRAVTPCDTARNRRAEGEGPHWREIHDGLRRPSRHPAPLARSKRTLLPSSGFNVAPDAGASNDRPREGPADGAARSWLVRYDQSHVAGFEQPAASWQTVRRCRSAASGTFDGGGPHTGSAPSTNMSCCRSARSGHKRVAPSPREPEDASR